MVVCPLVDAAGVAISPCGAAAAAAGRGRHRPTILFQF
jgi:hypothetical protein